MNASPSRYLFVVVHVLHVVHVLARASSNNLELAGGVRSESKTRSSIILYRARCPAIRAMCYWYLSGICNCLAALCVMLCFEHMEQRSTLGR